MAWIILMENEAVLQTMMDKCAEWLMQWRLCMNIEITKVVHYRKVSLLRTQFKFECCGKDVEVVNEYKYLGVILNETLNFTTTASQYPCRFSQFPFDGSTYLPLGGSAKKTKILWYSLHVQIRTETTKLYRDDIVIIWDQGEEKLKVFIKYMNEAHPTIKFTTAYSRGKVTFLDT